MKKFSIKHSIRWSIFISIVTFILASLFSIISTAALEGVTWAIGMVIVLLLISTGIIFDIMGTASAAAVESPYHAMASEKVNGSKQAIYIVRNADRFANFCNDVIGDICGVISGAASAIVIIKLFDSILDGNNPVLYTTVSVVFTGLVSAMTVGGKAIGKSFAIHYANAIILLVGKILYVLEHHLHIKVFQPKKNPKNGKRGNKRAARSNSTAK